MSPEAGLRQVQVVVTPMTALALASTALHRFLAPEYASIIGSRLGKDIYTRCIGTLPALTFGNDLILEGRSSLRESGMFSICAHRHALKDRSDRCHPMPHQASHALRLEGHGQLCSAQGAQAPLRGIVVLGAQGPSKPLPEEGMLIGHWKED